MIDIVLNKIYNELKGDHMSEIVETSLVLRKETKFDKLRKTLFMMFFKEEYLLMQKIDSLMMPKKINISKIVIPTEIGKEIRKL